jgi:hypothetical protein
MPAHIVEVHVDTAGRRLRRRLQAFERAMRPIVERAIQLQRVGEERAFLRPARNPDDAAPGALAELCDQTADRARSPEHY